jgi:outer membrane protein assembly factor BamB
MTDTDERGAAGDRRMTRRTALRAAGSGFVVGTLSGRASAQASGPTVYVGGGDGTLYALDAATGDTQWTFTRPAAGVGSSPTVVDGTVYVGSGFEDGALHAVDATTGDRQWVVDTGGGVSSSPTVVDGTVYVGSLDGTLYAVDAATGRRAWTVQTGESVRSSPTVVTDPASGDGAGSRARLGTLGHHDEWRHANQTVEIRPASGTVQTEEVEGSSSDSFGPGFGVGAALAGLGGACRLLCRLDTGD